MQVACTPAVVPVSASYRLYRCNGQPSPNWLSTPAASSAAAGCVCSSVAPAAIPTVTGPRQGNGGMRSGQAVITKMEIALTRHADLHPHRAVNAPSPQHLQHYCLQVDASLFDHINIDDGCRSRSPRPVSQSALRSVDSQNEAAVVMQFDATMSRARSSGSSAGAKRACGHQGPAVDVVEALGSFPGRLAFRNEHVREHAERGWQRAMSAGPRGLAAAGGGCRSSRASRR